MSLSLGVQLWGPDARSFRARAALAESIGFGSVTVPDHLAGGLPAPLTACAIIAASTERVRLGTLVLNNDFRHPVVLAREAAALADLSGGRFELGLGAGHMRSEYDRAGLAFDPASIRVERLCESARILSGLLAGGTVTLTGRHYSVREESCSLAPAGGVPILIGGNSERLHACAATFADIVGLVGFGHRRGGAEVDTSDFTTAALERQLSRLRRLAGERFPRLQIQALVQWHEVTSRRRRAAERVAKALELQPAVALDSPYVLLGTPDQIVEQLREHHERFGITRWTVFGDRAELTSMERLAPIVDRLAASSPSGGTGVPST